MEGTASRKVEGGKLVRVEALFETVFEDVGITGDFFLQPPEALEELEEAVEGMDVYSSREEFLESLERVDAELFGVSREDIAECLMEVVE